MLSEMYYDFCIGERFFFIGMLDCLHKGEFVMNDVDRFLKRVKERLEAMTPEECLELHEEAARTMAAGHDFMEDISEKSKNCLLISSKKEIK